MGDCLDIEAGKEYEEGDDGSDISDSEINQYKEAVHKLLKFRTYKIRCPNGDLICPFCVGVEKQGYNRLLEHSIRVAEGPTESGKQRANHLAMAKYLVIDLAADEKKKMDLRNYQMAEKLREVEENCRQLVEKVKKKFQGIEVALCNLEDIYQRSILKEQRSNEELEEVRLELIKKDSRNSEMFEKLREAEENYGGLVKRLESSLIALSEKNSMLESELARAKEDASSKSSVTALAEKKSMLESELDQAKEDANNTVAKLQEVEKMCLDLQQNLQSMEEKLSNFENNNHVLCQKLRKAEENYRGLVEKHKRSVFKERRSNNELEEFRIELIKMDLKNNEMAEKLRKAEERRKVEKEGALCNLGDVHQHSKERQSNDELEEVRLELIKLLSDLTSHSYIDYSFGVKRMGDIDEKALKNGCKKKFPTIVAKHKLYELRSSANTIYQSYEIIVDDKGNPQGLLKKNDKKLQRLKDELGEEIYNVLFASLFDRHECQRSGSYMDPEMWNFKENRKATLKEVICFLKTQNEEREPNLWNRWVYGGS